MHGSGCLVECNLQTHVTHGRPGIRWEGKVVLVPSLILNESNNSSLLTLNPSPSKGMTFIRELVPLSWPCFMNLFESGDRAS